MLGMKDLFYGFKYWKFILALVIGAALTYGLIAVLSFKLVDALMVTGSVTIVWSFTFIHRMGKYRASVREGAGLNLYRRFNMDMRYNMHEDEDVIRETLLAGILEFLAGAIILILK